METGKENFNYASIRWTKLRGVKGQMETWLKWKDDSDQMYRNEYDKLARDYDLKKEFDELHSQISRIIETTNEVPESEYDRLMNKWDMILAAIRKQQKNN